MIIDIDREATYSKLAPVWLNLYLPIGEHKVGLKIEIHGEVRHDDGTILVSSPNIPLFHMTVPTADGYDPGANWWKKAYPVLRGFFHERIKEETRPCPV